jgi:uncharacterized protein (TIGR01777 family)
MKIVIAGGTGFIGRHLAESLQRGGHEVVALTRDAGRGAARVPSGVRAVEWDARNAAGPWAQELRGAGAIVNLAGATIGRPPWTVGRKRMLTESRVRSTEALVGAIAALPAEARPQTLVNASGIDYYGDHPGDEALDESAPPGVSFLARLCVQWEDAGQKAAPLGVRVVRIRTAFVVGRGAMALGLLALPFRLFAGGPLGSGRQWFTWIHLLDLVNLYTLAIERPDWSGPVNAVAPTVPREREVAREIGRALRRPSWAPAPAFALRLALGEMADLLLHGRRAVPAKAEAAGYQFRYREIGPALAEALGPR